jgi:hypothetical protein
MGEFHGGVTHIIKGNPSVPAIQLFIHGAGKALPTGEAMLVPLSCDILWVLYWKGDSEQFMQALQEHFKKTLHAGGFPAWR